MSEQKSNDADLIGKTLGQFTILEEIGRGGMATVFKARQQSVNRIVAIKILPRHFLHDPGFLERFTREVDVASHLEHPHILPIYDYGETEGVPYIAMRYLAGGSMADMIRRGSPRLEDLEKPITQVAQALDYAHQQKGIVHRDLKPGNVMLDENGNAYLSDFGIVQVAGSDLTGSLIVGTPAYMSPEQAHGGQIDSRSDIYALGVVLFELITGHEPYQAETPMALLLKHINEPMPPVRDFREGVPTAVEDVIARATAKEPDDRYPSAGEMAKAFAQALRTADSAVETKASAPTKPLPTATDEVPTTALQGGEVAATSEVMTRALEANGGRSTGLLIGAVAVIAIVIIGAILILPSLTGDQTSAPGPTAIPQAALVPTPFPRASRISGDPYTISIPNDWIPPQLFIDQSDTDRLLHTWPDDDYDDGGAYISLALVDAGLTEDDGFDAAVSAYHATYYARQSQLISIDEATAPDGTLRRSYRVHEDDTLPPGQLDVFYLNRSPYLTVLEFYTTDSTGSTMVPLLQLVLDSLRVAS
jgi:serine/threonine protein kinase